MSDEPHLPTEAWLVALAELDQMGPARLRSLLGAYRPREAWRRIGAGSIPVAIGLKRDKLTEWRSESRGIDVGERWARYEASAVGVVAHGTSSYPTVLVDDPEPPAVLFMHGTPDPLRLPRVAIVGTRRCSQYGTEVAFELGHDLAAAGVCVVSGLALGIDGAAHAGALEAAMAPPIAVVAGGLDCVYPRRNRALWQAVVAAGAVITEVPLGVPPDRWRFPARNRIIAGLSDIVIVVESALSGGSMYTVTEAIRRDRPVMAVPGPIRAVTSAGTNRLLAEGCAPVCGVDDVLSLLGLSAAAALTREKRPAPGEAAAVVLDAFCWQPVDLEALLCRTGQAVGEVSLAIEELLAAGWIARRGAWLERVAVA